MAQLHEELSQIWLRIQGSLFPWLEEELGPLTEKQQQLVQILEPFTNMLVDRLKVKKRL